MEQKIKIWVMWSAQGPTLWKDQSTAKAKELWVWIAKYKCILITWACPGLPNEAALWADSENWYVIWISPAFSEKEHVETYRSPLTWYDMIIYTWKWLMERDITNIRSSDAIILVWGGIWTLNEFTIAYDEWKMIWILKGTWWISDNIPRVLDICNRSMEDRIVISSDPKELVERMILWLKEFPQPVFEDENDKTKSVKNY